MPIKKPQLGRSEQSKYLEHTQELQAAGLQCEIPSEWEENSRSLDIFVGPPQANILSELSTGITGCAIWVDILALTGNLILKRFSIASEWSSEWIAVCRNAGGWYGVGAALDFIECDTLNERIENGLHFRRKGDCADGWVLASSNQRIPDKYQQSMIAELCLTFTDQFGHDHCAQAKAVLERSARLKASDIRARKSPSLWPAEGVQGREDLEREVGVPISKLVSGKVRGHPTHKSHS